VIVYVIVVVPAATPVTTPDDDPIVAIAGVLLVQVPPDGVPDNIIVEPTHTAMVPVELVTADGNGLTVTVAVRIQPVGNV
jgi:hypothetical protein